MKNYLYLIMLFFLISCEKDNGKNHELGFLGSYLENNPDITILKTTESDLVYAEEFSTYRGYIFVPLVDIKLTAFGGQIAQEGKYKFEIFKLTENWYSKSDTILLDTIEIQDTITFQYKIINKKVILLAHERYLIRYFNESHNSVYDAGLGISQSEMSNVIDFPLTIEDVVIEIPYYTYQEKAGEEYYSFQEGTFDYGILRGLVDFKYEIANSLH